MRDPVQDFRIALERLGALERQVASGQGLDEVSAALTDLKLAVTRAYGGQRVRNPRGHGARTNILDYLLDHLGEWVYGEELAAVSGIGEWARRVRELRVESGYEIEENQGRYRLTSRDPNEARRDRWIAVTELRDAGGTAEQRVRLLLERLATQPVGVDELDRVARSKQGARIARDLRHNEAWPIECDADSPTLRSGEYRLASALGVFRLPGGQSLFHEDLRRQVFKRDGHRCWTCGGSEQDVQHDSGNPFYLLIRHLDASPAALSSMSTSALMDSSRLATSCNRCFTKP
jgi:biotin operon repressor/uncharacterized coiled-coil protein SlyX